MEQLFTVDAGLIKLSEKVTHIEEGQRDLKSERLYKDEVSRSKLARVDIHDSHAHTKGHTYEVDNLLSNIEVA
jgi:hypothetical protein